MREIGPFGFARASGWMTLRVQTRVWEEWDLYCRIGMWGCSEKMVNAVRKEKECLEWENGAAG